MHNIGNKLLIGLAITAIGMFAADSSLGTWKWTPAKSKSISTNPLTSRTDVYEATPDGGVKVTRTQQRADGTTSNFSYTFKYDGNEYPATGGTFDIVSAKRVDANTTVSVVKKTETAHIETSQNVYSKDGKTRTQTVKGISSTGKPVDSTFVFEKQ